MAPIRVGFIGLSATGSWAVGAHLPYLAKSSKYTIVALCNSSVESAHAAVAAHSLPPTTKTYASPEDVAADKDVDLVVCSVRVDKHYETILPAVKAGKACYVEWPLCSNYAQAKQLVDAAKESGSRIMVGLQAQTSPLVQKLRELVHGGRLGRITAVTITAKGLIGGPTVGEGGAYSVDDGIGGTMINIAGGHLFDTVLYAVDSELASLNATLTTQFPNVNVLDGQGKVVRTVERTAYDYLALQGQLSNGALFTAKVGDGSAYKGKPMQTWHIEGEKAEAIVTVPVLLQLSAGEVLTVHDRGADEAETIDTSETDVAVKHLPRMAQLVGHLYEAFAEERQGGFPDADWALKRHAMIQAMRDASACGERKSYLSP